ncbi:MAG: hypothetical protein ACYDGM_05240 [Vulcanimicrobiaceae bacterium]
MVTAFILMNVERPKLKSIAGESTETLISFRSFSNSDFGLLWDIGVD